MAIPTIRLRRKIEAEQYQRAAQTAELDHVVFLAGPFIEPSEENQSNYSAPALLRFRLFHMLEQAGFEVSLGEFKELIDSHKTELGQHHNAAAVEINHAQKGASLVVMIPASPGSFAEFGAFSIKEDICKKMIILSDVDHETSTGYMNTGPVACARSLGSQVVYIDFNDIEGCFEAVKKFADNVTTKMLLNMRLRA